MDKNKALMEYIAEYPQVYSWIYFNTITMLPGNTSLLTDADQLITSYINGSEEREYIFNVAFIHPYDTNTSDINVDAMAETENFINWIDEQNLIARYPDWSSNNLNITGIEVLSKIPLMTIDNTTNTAQYVIQCRITYWKEVYN